MGTSYWFPIRDKYQEMKQISEVLIINWNDLIISPECEIKSFSLCNYFVFDKFFYKPYLIEVRKNNIDKKRATDCSDMDSNDLCKI